MKNEDYDHEYGPEKVVAEMIGEKLRKLRKIAIVLLVLCVLGALVYFGVRK